MAESRWQNPMVPIVPNMPPANPTPVPAPPVSPNDPVTFALSNAGIDPVNLIREYQRLMQWIPEAPKQSPTVPLFDPRVYANNTEYSTPTPGVGETPGQPPTQPTISPAPTGAPAPVSTPGGISPRTILRAVRPAPGLTSEYPDIDYPGPPAGAEQPSVPGGGAPHIGGGGGRGPLTPALVDKIRQTANPQQRQVAAKYQIGQAYQQMLQQLLAPKKTTWQDIFNKFADTMLDAYLLQFPDYQKTVASMQQQRLAREKMTRDEAWKKLNAVMGLEKLKVLGTQLDQAERGLNIKDKAVSVALTGHILNYRAKMAAVGVAGLSASLRAQGNQLALAKALAPGLASQAWNMGGMTATGAHAVLTKMAQANKITPLMYTLASGNLLTAQREAAKQAQAARNKLGTIGAEGMLRFHMKQFDSLRALILQAQKTGSGINLNDVKKIMSLSSAFMESKQDKDQFAKVVRSGNAMTLAQSLANWHVKWINLLKRGIVNVRQVSP